MTAGQRLLAIGLVLGVTLVAFEVTAVVTAMPTITDELDGDSLYGLAIAVYTLANMVALVAAGELADRHGPALPYADLDRHVHRRPDRRRGGADDGVGGDRPHAAGRRHRRRCSRSPTRS